MPHCHASAKMAPKWRFSPNLIQIVPDHNRYKPCGNNRLQMLLDFSPDSSGTGYIINAAQRSEWKEIGLYPVIQVLPVQSHSLLLLSSFTKIVAFSRSGLLWASGHLVHDDLRINGIKKEHIECTGWDPWKEERSALKWIFLQACK
jgi:hypothetical protein